MLEEKVIALVDDIMDRYRERYVAYDEGIVSMQDFFDSLLDVRLECSRSLEQKGSDAVISERTPALAGVNNPNPG